MRVLEMIKQNSDYLSISLDSIVRQAPRKLALLPKRKAREREREEKVGKFVN